MRVDLALMAELDRAFEKENRQNAQLSELGLSLQSTTQTAEAMQKRLIDQQERILRTHSTKFFRGAPGWQQRCASRHCVACQTVSWPWLPRMHLPHGT
jgi:hypothetical protein